MRILFVSNAGWSHQGYGVQVKGLLPHLIEQGHDLAVFAFWGLDGGKVDLPLGGQDGPLLTHYPRISDPYGNDAVAGHAADFGADCVITLMDVWVNDPAVYQPLNWLAWLPIDMAPIPDPVLARLPHMLRILPYSEYGEALVRQTGLPCTRIPHGVDTEVYRPFSSYGRARAKETLGFGQDDFVVGMVGANKGFPSRKGFPEAFQAFARLRESAPDARLYVHSQISTAHGGPNLQHLAELCGIAPYVRFADPYQLGVGLPAHGMAIIYNALDVLLQSSTHEGFGLPMLEAQACGTPVVAVDATSMHELVAPAYGVLVPPLQQQLATLMSWVAVPDVQALANALGRVRAQPPGSVERGMLRSWAERFAWSTVAEHYWKPVLDEVAEQLGAPTSQDRRLKQALQGADVIPTMLGTANPEHRHDPRDREAEPCCQECCDCGTYDEFGKPEGSHHNCCCEHVVDELEAMPGPEEEILNVARDKLAACPHQPSLTNLEEFVLDLRERLAVTEAVAE